MSQLKSNIICLPLVPLKNSVVFPGFTISMFIGAEKSIKAVEYAIQNDVQIFFVLQESQDRDVLSEKDVHSIGTVCRIESFIKLTDGTLKVLVKGGERAKIKNTEDGEIIKAFVEIIPENDEYDDKIQVLMMAAISHFESFASIFKKVHGSSLDVIKSQESPSRFADAMAAYLPLDHKEHQMFLSLVDVKKRIENLIMIMESKIKLSNMEKKIKARIKKQIDKNQKEYYLNEQLKAIHRELGEQGDIQEELEDLKKKIKESGMHKEAAAKAHHELKRLRSLTPLSQEGSIIRTYLNWLIEIPWKNKSGKKNIVEISDAKLKLDESHYGLKKVKERIMEYIAVWKRLGKLSGQIMCFFGPPGVGKTSLGKAIANAMGREFVRISLGGMSDEAEIRGHRRTYLGAMPGKIIHAMKKANVVNPVIMLDEIDKIGSDWRGDPSAALLEVLDPEQNNTFVDNYIDIPYDLSQVIFITTANSLKIPGPLLDRMEIINISGYTEYEKIEIAKQHIIPKQMKQNGLRDGEILFDDDAIRCIIRKYTMESGLRGLERQISKISRKVVLEHLEQDQDLEHQTRITPDSLEKYLEAPKYNDDHVASRDIPGVVTGLAWTESGGDVLYIESLTLDGDGKVITTGKLGDVMQESIKAAHSYVRANISKFGITKEDMKQDIHIHVPEGATPKDGPSAGITICTSLVSALTKKHVDHRIAMTGEITLVGNVLAIGGLREKLLAAVRNNIKTVFVPYDNKKDIADIPTEVLDTLEIQYVKHVDDVLNKIFL